LDISIVKYIFDKKNKRDLILSLSESEKKIKVWNLRNMECLINLKNISESTDLYYYIHICFLYDNNKNYIITAGCNYCGIKDTIKLFDLEGNKINEIENKEQTYYIESYYDNKSCKIYIITCHEGFLILNDYQNKEVYILNNEEKINEEKINEEKIIFHGLIIKEYGEIVKIISKANNFILIWNLNTRKMIQKIIIENYKIISFCLWNNNDLFIGCYDGILLLMDLRTNKIIKKEQIKHHQLIDIQKVIHPIYKECLLLKYNTSQEIYLLSIKKNF